MLGGSKGVKRKQPTAEYKDKAKGPVASTGPLALSGLKTSGLISPVVVKLVQ
jgi:hypothetical protein